jgi:formyl-CoA transferase
MGIPVRTGNRLSRLAPWNSYRTKDGYVVICVANNPQWQSFLEAIGREDLKKDARFKDQQGRHKHSDEVELIIGEWIKDLTKGEVVERLSQKKVPCEAVAEFDEVLKSPRLMYRGMIQNVIHPFSGDTGLKAAGFPIKFSRLKAEPLAPAPYPGQHNEEVYGGILGLSTEQINTFRKEGII